MATAGSQLTCTPLPPGSGVSALERDCLIALGKRPSREGWPSSRERARRLLAIWIEASRTTEVILHSSNLFAEQDLQDLERALAQGGARLTLYSDNPRDGTQRGRARTWDAPDPTPARPLAGTDKHRTDPGEWLNDSSPWLALATAGLVLLPDERADFESAFQTAAEWTGWWLRSRPEIVARDAEEFLAVALADRDPVRAWARHCGASTALLDHGLLLGASAPAPRCQPPTRTASELRSDIKRTVQPDVAAALALYSTARFTVSALQTIDLSQVRDLDGGGLEVCDVPLAGDLATAVRAQCIFHRETRAGDGPLLSEKPLQRLQALRVRPAPRRVTPKVARVGNHMQRSWSFVTDIAADIPLGAPIAAADAELMRTLLSLSPSAALRLARLPDPLQEAAHRLERDGCVHIRSNEVYCTRAAAYSQLRSTAPDLALLVEDITATRAEHRSG